MYNSDVPSKEELPTPAKLIKSTLIAIAVAFVLLVTVILPAEYNVDPTGIGKLLGLAEMGEIKEQLHEEAEAEKQSFMTMPESLVGKMAYVAGELFGVKPAKADHGDWHEAIEITLDPGQGAEVKLVMNAGKVASFEWVSEGGRANYDLHGDAKKKSITYRKGRGVTSDKGELKAAFTGNHGWFWRNRDKQPIKIILRVKGDFKEIKRVI